MAIKWSMASFWKDRPEYLFQGETHKADWDAHGKAAGPIRNRKMAQEADALLLLWDGKSKGSASMLAEAKRTGLQIVSLTSLTSERFPPDLRMPGTAFKAYRTTGIGIGNVEAVSKLTF